MEGILKRINTKMIPVKLFGSFLYMATSVTFPYLTMQMLQIGLDFNDVSIVYGIVPLMTFLTSPLAGYIGDKIGYNVVLVVNLIGAGLTSTAFDWTPRFYEYKRDPIVSILQNDSRDEILKFTWPLECDQNVTKEDCMNADILQNNDFWLNLTNYGCDSAADFSINTLPIFQYFDIVYNKINQTMCTAQVSNETWPTDWEITEYQVCNLTNLELTSCYSSEGSHMKTFWVYFTFRMLFQMSLICCFSAFDGTALRQAREFNSDYTWVTFYGTIASGLAPFLSAYTIKDAPEGSDEENDYTMAFYVADGLYLITLIMSLFVKVNPVSDDNPDKDGDKKDDKKKEIKGLFSPSALIFFAIIFQGGIMWGVKDTYFFVYLQDELKADSAMIAYFNVISILSGVFVLPVAKFIIEKIGHVHICYLAIMVDVVRVIICSLVKQSPPVYVYGLVWMDFLCSTLYWTSAIKYTYKIAPPTLVGTMAALTGSVNWIIAKGLSSFVAGQLMGQNILTLSQMFRVFGVFVGTTTTFFYLIYLVFGRKLEADLSEKVEQKRLELEGKTGEKLKIEEMIENYVPGVHNDSVTITSF